MHRYMSQQPILLRSPLHLLALAVHMVIYRLTADSCYTMRWDTAASLALLYLILYAAVLAQLIALYALKKISIRSRYSFITFHVLIRLASQAVGLAFALVGYANVSLLVAYFILGAEGYFSLVLCAYRFLIAWHQEHFLSGESWLEPKQDEGKEWWKRLGESFTFYSPGRGVQWMGLIHCFLIAANTLIIVGGTMLSGGNTSPETFGEDGDEVNKSTVFRTVGQTIFLVINIGLLAAMCLTIYQAKVESQTLMNKEDLPQTTHHHSHSTATGLRQEKFESQPREESSSRRASRYPHPTLILLLIAWPLLIVRGFYGLLNPFIEPFNYFIAENYDAHGLTLEFITYEYVLGTTMEWASCALLVGTWWTERWRPGMREEHAVASAGR